MPPLILNKIDYSTLNARQKENYNFHKISAVLADYGFVSLRLSDDWQGADFIAVHIDGETFVRVQAKGRFGFCKKYLGKNLYVAFCSEGEWYLYPHDEVLKQVLEQTGIATTESWAIKGVYHFPYLSPDMRKFVAPYRIGSR
jgi:hypothetical protein